MDSKRFSDLWNKCAQRAELNCESNPERIFEFIDTQYSEPHRFYHASSHIDHCLKQFDSADIDGDIDEGMENDKHDVIELSIWFHDVIYEIGNRENEARSAVVFSDYAQNCLSEDLASKVNACILSTTHREPPVDEYSKTVVDIDLSGFGQDWDGFSRDSENLRKENSHIELERYIVGQIGFMEKLLSRERIYSTQYFYRTLESKARNNISRQLDIYSKGN